MPGINPAAVVRDLSSSPNHTREVHCLAGRIVGGGTHVVTIETKLRSVLVAQVVKENATTAVLAATIDDSTTYPGTKTVAFTVANGGVYSYVVVGFVNREPDVPETSGATTVVYEPIEGR